MCEHSIFVLINFPIVKVAGFILSVFQVEDLVMENEFLG